MSLDSMFIFCEKCGKEQEFFITDIQEGDDCWKVIELECSVCGKKKKEKINS